MRILLADDHAIVRSGLRRILADAFGGATIGEVGSCKEVREEGARGGLVVTLSSTSHSRIETASTWSPS